MTGLTILFFIMGLALLVGGAELLVRNAARLASDIGIPAIIVGLTVVAFGTSAPELAISLAAAFQGEPEIALGNVIGSNIANILLILGLSAVIVPLAVAQHLVRIDVPIMVGVSILVLIMSLSGVISRWHGLLLVLILIIYLVWVVRTAAKESQAVKEEYAAEFGADRVRSAGAIGKRTVMLIVGLLLILLGARWLVESATEIALAFGVSELVIGLTIVAIGTSAPEIATSLVAALRGERDIAVGNVVGSNLFNLLFVLGAAALVAPDGIPVPPAAQAFDIPFMTAVAIACFPVFFTGNVVARWEGVLFLGYYTAYLLYLLLAETHHQALPRYSTFMAVFVTPLVVLGLTLSVIQELRRRRRQRVA
jgi:cation:H+ antiporter